MAGKTKNSASVTAHQPKQVKPADSAVAFVIPRWAPAVVLIFTALLYSRALQNAFTGFDDNYYVYKNPLLNDFSLQGVKVIFTSFYFSNYHPLTLLVYLFEFKFFGLDPMPYHLLNVLLHLANTWLVFRLSEQLSGNKLTALVVMILFAIHPMHVESVAWVSEMKDVLYSLFFLLSVLVYLRYKEDTHSVKHYWLALLFFLLSLLSKSAAVTLPVLLIAIDIYKGHPVNARLLKDKLPFLLLALVFGIVNMISFKTSGTLNESTATYGFINRVFLFTYAVQSYVVRAVIPYSLSAMHHYPPISANGMLPWHYYISLPFVLLLSWLVIRWSALRKEVVFGTLFFLIIMSIMLQIISFSSHLYAERYTYISYIGLFYIAGQWISKTGIIKWRNTVLGVCAVLFLVYSAQSWARISVWKDSMSLFNDMVEKEPDVYFGYFSRGNAEKYDGNLQAALEDYNTAIKMNPTFEDLYYNRGTIYDAYGNAKLAIMDYTMAIKLKPQSPDAYNNRGWAYFQSGDTAAAIRDIDKAISLKPEYYEAYNNRGWIYYQSGKLNVALQDFNKALEINPDYDRPRNNRATLKGNMGDYKGAMEDFNYLVQKFPEDNSAYYFRGVTHLMMKDTGAACNDFNKAKGLGNEKAAGMISQFCR